MRRQLLAERHRALARQRGGGERRHSGARQPLQAQQAAGALGDRRRAGVRAAQQGGGQRRLVRVQPSSVLAEQRLRQGFDADHLAAPRHRVQVRLQDLALAPRRFQPRRFEGLRHLDRHAAPAGGARQVGVEQAGELHRQRRGAAGASAPGVGPGALGDGAPVDAGVLVEAPVLAQHHGAQQGGRHGVERQPRQAPHGGVGAQRLHGSAVARQQRHVGRAVGGLDLLEGRQGGCRQGTEGEGQDGDGAQRGQAHRPAGAAIERWGRRRHGFASQAQACPSACPLASCPCERWTTLWVDTPHGRQVVEGAGVSLPCLIGGQCCERRRRLVVPRNCGQVWGPPAAARRKRLIG